MNKPLLVIFTTIALDAVGIGLIFPVLPRLLEEVTRSSDIVHWIGIMTALYALMQFIFAPVLGALSDNLGRRPVLLLSLAGMAVNYVAMAFAPLLWMLMAGRAIAGATSANMAVAMAYITDISSPDIRARRFGLFNAMFGIGFIIGPVLGGILGDYGVRLPFIAAAVLCTCNLLMALFVLPESRSVARQKINISALNPLRPLRQVLSMKHLLPLILVFFIFTVVGEVYGTIWALWGIDTFQWSGLWIGLSLGVFGVCSVLVQAFLPGPASRLLGERGAVLAGVAVSCVALVILSFTLHGWMVFAVMPLFALGGIGSPALQALATRQVDNDRQGQFQGVLASMVSLASITAPLAFSSLYFLVQKSWPGAIWLFVVVIYVISVPLIILATRNTGQQNPPQTQVDMQQ